MWTCAMSTLITAAAMRPHISNNRLQHLYILQQSEWLLLAGSCLFFLPCHAGGSLDQDIGKEDSEVSGV